MGRTIGRSLKGFRVYGSPRKALDDVNDCGSLDPDQKSSVEVQAASDDSSCGPVIDIVPVQPISSTAYSNQAIMPVYSSTLVNSLTENDCVLPKAFDLENCSLLVCDVLAMWHSQPASFPTFEETVPGSYQQFMAKLARFTAEQRRDFFTDEKTIWRFGTTFITSHDIMLLPVSRFRECFERGEHQTKVDFEIAVSAFTKLASDCSGLVWFYVADADSYVLWRNWPHGKLVTFTDPPNELIVDGLLDKDSMPAFIVHKRKASDFFAVSFSIYSWKAHQDICASALAERRRNLEKGQSLIGQRVLCLAPRIIEYRKRKREQLDMSSTAAIPVSSLRLRHYMSEEEWSLFQQIIDFYEKEMEKTGSELFIDEAKERSNALNYNSLDFELPTGLIRLFLLDFADKAQRLYFKRILSARVVLKMALTWHDDRQRGTHLCHHSQHSNKFQIDSTAEKITACKTRFLMMAPLSV